jgi:dTDP-4-dehydrorhamnose reductase
VGSALLRVLKQRGSRNLLTLTHAELDLTRQEAVEHFFQSERPEVIEKTVKNIQEDYAKLQIAGWHHGYSSP